MGAGNVGDQGETGENCSPSNVHVPDMKNKGVYFGREAAVPLVEIRERAGAGGEKLGEIRGRSLASGSHLTMCPSF